MRLLAGTQRGTLSLAHHEAAHGPRPTHGRADLADLLAAAGLRGRGGAGFPTAVKLRGVAGQRGPRNVLVNGSEGEPMSAKDRTLLALAPHLVLDGALAVAAAVDAHTITVTVREDAPRALAAMRHAVAERGLGATADVVAVPAAYLSGEETALIRFLDGGPLKPTSSPLRPYQRGLGGRPTLVHNPETLAHVALIERRGPDWFRELGTAALPGSTLVTIAGAVRAPGVFEIACGTPLPEAIAHAGGESEPLRAVLVGGYHGVWLDATDMASVSLDPDSLSRHGGSLGAGVIVALARSACPVTELASTLQWLAAHSASQCGPCANGLPAIAALLGALREGRADPAARERLDRWGRSLLGRGACQLPDGAVRFLISGMRVFAREIATHEREGACTSCPRPTTLLGPSLRRRATA